jgi:hypothetical protein
MPEQLLSESLHDEIVIVDEGLFGTSMLLRRASARAMDTVGRHAGGYSACERSHSTDDHGSGRHAAATGCEAPAAQRRQARSRGRSASAACPGSEPQRGHRGSDGWRSNHGHGAGSDCSSQHDQALHPRGLPSHPLLQPNQSSSHDAFSFLFEGLKSALDRALIA